MKYIYYTLLLFVGISLILYFDWPRYTMLIMGVFMIANELFESTENKKIKVEIDLNMNGIDRFKVFNGR